ncbi:alpha-amylase/alpha-mannosidase [Caldisphaera lagunensis DSM 15908]|uniref:Alpha-amylase/alpha-mannosidase n=1 Tax=Caldisphaera lagunensis (strain DSM 15908 / JCM 11604 / ANMR 0165 / IC-154) TaxID=1056495 RepID=L0AAH7_CALLD|nr:glycoside hydrolase family 57 protein [Caldisphaera lagunensis]AFZ70434.1 alpha-amylase/alpha-mannosidase [Caldisphaera lagunensis DSM 15908]
MEIALLFEMHQPARLKKLSEFPPTSIPENLDEIFDNYTDKIILDRVTERTYRHATKILKNNIEKYKDFKINFSISGILLEQLNKNYKDVIKLFQDLANTERVEFLSQTYYHSLAWFIDKREFYDQIKMQSELVEDIIGYKPKSAENTEFIYNNDIGCFLKEMGFDVVVTEGVDYILNGRSPNKIYKNPLCNNKVVLRNYRLSDDIGFRFSNRNWEEYPLTADKYAYWINVTPGDFLLIAIDYETFGEHHNPSTGIYEFLDYLPKEILKFKNLRFSNINEAGPPGDYYDVPPFKTISWADERDLSAWLGNPLQKDAFNTLRKLYYYARYLGKDILESYRKLTISDHLYYMATKYGSMNEVHTYFNPMGGYEKAFHSFIIATTILSQKLRQKINENMCEFLRNFELPDDLCFYFNYRGNISKACSIEQLLRKIKEFPKDYLDSINEYVNQWLSQLFMIKDINEISKRCPDLYI